MFCSLLTSMKDFRLSKESIFLSFTRCSHIYSFLVNDVILSALFLQEHSDPSGPAVKQNSCVIRYHLLKPQNPGFDGSCFDVVYGGNDVCHYIFQLGAQLFSASRCIIRCVHCTSGEIRLMIACSPRLPAIA